jgi:hypothetical protein
MANWEDVPRNICCLSWRYYPQIFFLFRLSIVQIRIWSYLTSKEKPNFRWDQWIFFNLPYPAALYSRGQPDLTALSRLSTKCRIMDFSQPSGRNATEIDMYFTFYRSFNTAVCAARNNWFALRMPDDSISLYKTQQAYTRRYNLLIVMLEVSAHCHWSKLSL